MFPQLFPILLVILWLAIAAALARMPGWSDLTQRYPDRPEPSVLQLKWQSGMLRGGSMRGMLKLAVCPSGLRIGIMKTFGLWNQDFFVPWNEIRISRKAWWFGPVAELSFGDPEVGKLSIAGHIADRLARSAKGRWPEVPTARN